MTEAAASPTAHLAASYPSEPLAFGSDLGHTDYPAYHEGVTTWFESAETLLGTKNLETIMTTNGRRLLEV